jgi:division protein CdvB (Snf7/Vps24/ESCRT-III family)
MRTRRLERALTMMSKVQTIELLAQELRLELQQEIAEARLEDRMEGEAEIAQLHRRRPVLAMGAER